MAWTGPWSGDWYGQWDGGLGESPPGAMSGSALINVSASGTLTTGAQVNAAGKGRRTLADYEAEWANRSLDELPAQVRRRVKRQAAREVYLAPPLPDVAQVYVDRLKADKEAAQLAEMRALLDLQAQASAVQAEIARAAVAMARRKQEEAARALEEFDVMYVAAILAEA